MGFHAKARKMLFFLDFLTFRGLFGIFNTLSHLVSLRAHCNTLPARAWRSEAGSTYLERQSVAHPPREARTARIIGHGTPPRALDDENTAANGSSLPFAHWSV